MAGDYGSESEEYRIAKRTVYLGASDSNREDWAEEAGASHASSSVLRDTRLKGRGNESARISAIQRIQQTVGNRAMQRYLLGSAPATKQVHEGDETGHTQVGSSSRSSADLVIQRWTDRGEGKRGGDESPAGTPPKPAIGSTQLAEEEEDSLIREQIASFYVALASIMPVDVKERRTFLSDLKQAGYLPVHPDQRKPGFRPVEHINILQAPAPAGSQYLEGGLSYEERLEEAKEIGRQRYFGLMPAAKEVLGALSEPAASGAAPSTASSSSQPDAPAAQGQGPAEGPGKKRIRFSELSAKQREWIYGRDTLHRGSAMGQTSFEIAQEQKKRAEFLATYEVDYS